MIVHNYSSETQEYIGSEEAFPNPLEPGGFILPQNSTTESPPSPISGKARVFDGQNWTYVDDYRGVDYWVGFDKGPPLEIGEPFPEGASTGYPGRSPAELSREVNRESQRRASIGFMFRGVAYDFDDISKLRMTGAGALAMQAVNNGAAIGDFRWFNADTDFVWITKNNGLTPMDAQTCAAFAKAAAEHESLFVFAAYAIKQAGFPEGWENDSNWPVTGVQE